MMTRRMISWMLFLFTLVFAAIPIANADELVVTEDGKVGIGINQPAQILHIHQNGWSGMRVTTNNTGSTISDGVNFGYDDSYGAYIWNSESSPIILSTNNTERIRVTSDGNVGIGTTNPRVTVDVPKNLDVQGGLYIGNKGVYNGTINSDDSLYVNIDANSDQENCRFQVGTKANNSTGGAVPLLTVLENGNVGIGTTNPTVKIEVNGDIKMTGTNSCLLATNRLHIYSEELLYILNKSGVVIGKDWGGNGNLTVQGLINGVVVGNSDARWKENVETLDNPLEKVTQLRGVSYDWIDKSRGEGRQLGVIAQEVETVFPEVVHTDSQGYKSVEYAKLVAPLIEAVKELKAENEALASENQSLRKANQCFEERLAKVESILSKN